MKCIVLEISRVTRNTSQGDEGLKGQNSLSNVNLYQVFGYNVIVWEP